MFVIGRYCKLLIQEMELKVDQGFINAMMAMFASSETTDEDERRFFDADLERTRKALVEDLRESSANEQKHFYDMLHFSPLKVSFLESIFFYCLLSLHFFFLFFFLSMVNTPPGVRNIKWLKVKEVKGTASIN